MRTRQQALTPLTRPALIHHSVQDAIRAYILGNNLGPGAALPPETDLARQLGVSRNSVREAVKGLESLGVVETRRGTGLVVGAFSFAALLEGLSYGLRFDLRDLAELMELRRVLEVGLIEPAMSAMPAAVLADLGREAAAMVAHAERGELFAAEDRRFHQLLFEHLGNRTLIKLLDVFWLAFRDASEQADLRVTEPVAIARAHVAIVDAVAAGNPAAARDALDRHYDGLRGRLADADAYAAARPGQGSPRLSTLEP